MTFERLSVAELVQRLDDALTSGSPAEPEPLPTGFGLLDEEVGGGLHPGDLVLLAGPHGVGKTTWALQVARNVAASGHEALYICFEEPPHALLTRLLSREVCLFAGDEEAITVEQLRRVLQDSSSAEDLAARLHRYRGAAAGLESVASWSHRLRLSSPASRDVGLAALTSLIAERDYALVVVDYLQKVAPERAGSAEKDHVTEISVGLKDLAKSTGTCLLALVAAEMAALAPGHRLRTHELRGSSSLAYEPDLILIMDEKYEVVARHHLVYDTAGAQRYHDYVMLTVDKNRSGPAGLRLDLRKRLAHGHFAADITKTREEVADDRVHS